MKLLFLSNYYSHHQKPTCEQWYKTTEKSFSFVATEEMTAERKEMGWESETAPFTVTYDASVQPDIDHAEIVILGNAPLDTVKKRLRRKKTVFKYSERLFKRGYSRWKWPLRVLRWYGMFTRHKSLYLMAASAYTYADFARHFVFLGKAYKWGYFPTTCHYDCEDLFSKKDPACILWCGRMIDWKHPEQAVLLAKQLKEDGVDFQLDMIGSGPLEEDLQAMIKEYDLESHVKLLGAMTPQDVRVKMEKAGIYIFTSDFNEGWGAVLNESMNSGCAVVASHAIGAVPFLVKHGENGLVYQNGDAGDLYRKVKTLLKNPEKQKELGEKAYKTITELWNAETAAERFLVFADEIEKKGTCDLFEDGPCSRASVLKNNWFKEADYDISWLEN